MAKLTTNLVLPTLFLFMLANCVQVFALQKRRCIFTIGYHIHITNKIPSNRDPLFIRCQSKDDDLGNHTLTSGQEYVWSFCENFFRNTLFFCHARWGSKNLNFDAFNAKWGDLDDCFWEAKVDGLYMSTGENTVPKPFRKYHPWPK